MKNTKPFMYTLLSLAFMIFPFHTQASLLLVDKGRSNYKIVISANANPIDVEAASVLQKYILKMSGALLPIINDNVSVTLFEVRIGRTSRQNTTAFNRLNPSGLLINVTGTVVTLTGGKEKGVLYSVYTFLEKQLGCRKYTSDPAFIPAQSTITIASDINIIENPVFTYREVYYPESADQEYLDWHKLHRLDEYWGLWGHTFDKLVPAKEFFSTHPEYYALVDGQRKPSQLCLSNPEVFKILTNNLRNKIAADPAKKYWSVSQNDDLGFCECDKCKAIDKKEGGPQGSILLFVNKVAALFPDKIITTLAYTYSRHAPRTLKPALNVTIMFCSIECNRAKPIATDALSAGFRKDLRDWSLITKNLFIWDYVVQFTNYVSPFPNMKVLQPNIHFFEENGIKGLFEQGSGNTPAEFSELRAYLLAKLSWDPSANVDQLTTEFLQYYYGKAAPFIKSYMQLLHESLASSGKILDIYGTPVREYNTYLSPDLIEKYGQLLDQAEAAVEDSPLLLKHVHTARLPVDYAVLQQSRFYGIEKHGLFIRDANDIWISRPGFVQKVKEFVSTCKIAGIKLLTEGGLTPDQYLEEWAEVFKSGPKDHLAIGATVIPLKPYSPEYPNKGPHTLTDGSRGYSDFQYNWLGWYGGDMEIVVDMGKGVAINEINISFLEDQRHWAFLPAEVTIALSDDGKIFNKVGAITNKYPDENYEVSVKDYKLTLKQTATARYIKVTATNLKALPLWRYVKGKRAWLFADEIMVL
jgi:hypothetical protein